MSNSRVLLPLFALLTFLTSVPVVALTRAACRPLLSSLPSSLKSTEVYLALVRRLVKEKGVFSQAKLAEMSAQNTLPNPLGFLALELGASDKFSYQKAFATLAKVDWNKVKPQLARLARELQSMEIAKEDAEVKTTQIYAPIEIMNTFLPLKFRTSVTTFVPRGKTPLIAADAQDDAKIYDLSLQTTRTINHLRAYPLFVELRNGRVLVSAFGKKDLTIRLEDAESGELVDTFNLEQIISREEAQLSHPMFQLYVKEDGSLQANIKFIDLTNQGYRDPYIYNFTSKTGYFLKNTHQNTLHEGATGQLFEFDSIDVTDQSDYFPIYRFDRDQKKKLGEISSSDLGEKILLRRSYFPEDGRVFAMALGNDALIFLDGNSRKHLVKGLSSRGIPVMHVELTEWPRGEPAAASVTADASGTEFTLIDKQGNIFSVHLPQTQTLTFRRLQLKNGKIIFFAFGVAPPGADNGYLIDPEKGVVRGFHLAPEGNASVRDLYELDDGRIEALIQDRGQILRVFQLYGPIPKAAP